MGWKVTFGGTLRPADELAKLVETDEWASRWDGGTVVDLDDLPPATYDEIALVDGTGNWWDVYMWPGATSTRLNLVLAAAAEVAGVPAPEVPANMRGVRALLLLLERTEDIAEQPMENGFPPKPDETERGSSSISSGDTDGSPPTSEPSPSVTS